ARHSQGAQAFGLGLGLVAADEATEADAVEVGPGVEVGVGRLAGLVGQAAGEVFGLVLVAQGGDLQAEEAGLGGAGGRLDAHRGDHGDHLVVRRDGRLRRAAGEGERGEVARQAGRDAERCWRAGGGLRGGWRRRRRRGRRRRGRRRRGGGGRRHGARLGSRNRRRGGLRRRGRAGAAQGQEERQRQEEV